MNDSKRGWIRPACRSLAAAVLLTSIAASPAVARTGHRSARAGAAHMRTARIVEVSRDGVTYQLPSGRRLVLGSHGVHVEAAPGFVEYLSTGTITTESGVDYQMTVDADRGSGGGGTQTNLAVVLSRVAEGSGTTSTQYHVYFFTLRKGALSFSLDAPSAKVSTGSALGDWGTLKLNFRPKGSATQGCVPEHWHGSSTGSFSR